MALYDLTWIDQYIDELCDKMGSDLFPLPIKMKRFIAMTYDLIRENTNFLEGTQEISDDIKPLIARNVDVDMVDQGNGVYTVDEPDDYLRLIQIIPMYLDGTLKQKAKKVKIIKTGQDMAYNERDPFRKPSPSYPTVLRYDLEFEINVGQDTVTYTKARMMYVKKHYLS